ncbi:hypothetical protein AA0113_g9221 [Alternaria arborescens]|uniref:RING-type domain-containing protein n=1 Tax=Alternaria arborescens TaxID=156630 RepID=A0A4Q4RC07_9PLEO|nr:hypothetical protein AA0111_g10537 [Alternaria arborescens]RYO19155.1 hypothetical protein AA0111_g10537 [Alternaria arborescens]RYO54107.1 hypothetical protein AA0113_g9221 [Alternaria arborescens]
MSSNNTEEEAPTGAKSGTIVVAIVVPSVLIILLLGLIIMNRRRGSIFRPCSRAESGSKEKRWKTRQDELESHIKSQNFYDWLASQKEKSAVTSQPHDPLCAICLDDFSDDAQVRGLHCSHAFHSRCLDEWFIRYNEYCPLCHRPIIPGSRASRRKARERLDPTFPVVLMV